jgi:type I restriction enzyme S subunit
MGNLNAGFVARLRLPCPPLEEQVFVMDSIEVDSATNRSWSDAAQREIDLLRECRTCLIADVVTGGLDVRTAAADILEEASA